MFHLLRSNNNQSIIKWFISEIFRNASYWNIAVTCEFNTGTLPLLLLITPVWSRIFKNETGDWEKKEWISSLLLMQFSFMVKRSHKFYICCFTSFFLWFPLLAITTGKTRFEINFSKINPFMESKKRTYSTLYEGEGDTNGDINDELSPYSCQPIPDFDCPISDEVKVNFTSGE